MLTKQEAFDKVLDGIRKQGGGSFVPSKMSQNRFHCQYRGPNNRKCGAGHLIDDADYRPVMEGEGITLNGLCIAGSAVSKNYSDLKFVADMQHAHDSAIAESRGEDNLFLESFNAKMKKVATEHRVQYHA